MDEWGDRGELLPARATCHLHAVQSIPNLHPFYARWHGDGAAKEEEPRYGEKAHNVFVFVFVKAK